MKILKIKQTPLLSDYFSFHEAVNVWFFFDEIGIDQFLIQQ